MVSRRITNKWVASLVLAGALAAPSVYPQTTLARPGATMTFVPVRASGIECASPGQDPSTCDWFVAGPRQIILNRGNQDVSIELFLSDWDPDQAGIRVAAYQGALDCATFSDPVSGLALSALSQLCFDAPGGFNDFCLGIDTSRPDFVLFGDSIIPACQNNAPCPDGTLGHFVCGAVALGGGGAVDSGIPVYGATLAVHVPLGLGTFHLGLDPDDTQTLVRDQGGNPVGPLTLFPADITIRCGTNADCDDGIPCTQDTCSTLFGICQNPLQAGSCMIGGVCASQGDDNPANDCETCDPATATNAWSLRPAGDACGSSGAGTCLSLDVCDGAGTCQLGEVTLFDYAEFSDCLGGPTPALLSPCCQTFDAAPDNDVDLADYAEFQVAFTGP